MSYLADHLTEKLAMLIFLPVTESHKRLTPSDETRKVISEESKRLQKYRMMIGGGVGASLGALLSARLGIGEKYFKPSKAMIIAPIALGGVAGTIIGKILGSEKQKKLENYPYYRLMGTGLNYDLAKDSLVRSENRLAEFIKFKRKNPEAKYPLFKSLNVISGVSPSKYK